MSNRSNEIKVLLISQIRTDRIGGGVEVFVSHMKHFFPNITILDPKSFELGNDIEFRMSKTMVESTLDNYDISRYDLIITLGLGGWYFSKLKRNIPVRFNIFQGNWHGYRDTCYSFFSQSFFSITFNKIHYELMSAKNAINISPSKFVSDFLEKDRFESIELLYNTTLMNYERTDNANHILFIGRPIREKGFDTFIEIARRFKNERFTAVLFGEEQNIQLDNLNIHYNVPYEKMPEFYKKAKLLLFPSLFEGNSYTILESLSQDIPVIGSKVGLLWEQGPDFPGFIVNGGINEYEKILKDFTDNGIKGSPREFFLNNYSPEIVKDQLESILERIF